MVESAEELNIPDSGLPKVLNAFFLERAGHKEDKERGPRAS